jgi:hypothetical protein
VKVPTQHIWTKYHLHIAIAGIKLGVIHGVSLADLGWTKPLAHHVGVNQILQKYHGSLNVPIEHHPTIRYMVHNGYYKVMSNISKMGQLPTPEYPEMAIANNKPNLRRF